MLVTIRSCGFRLFYRYRARHDCYKVYSGGLRLWRYRSGGIMAPEPSMTWQFLRRSDQMDICFKTGTLWDFSNRRRIYLQAVIRYSALREWLAGLQVYPNVVCYSGAARYSIQRHYSCYGCFPSFTGSLMNYRFTAKQTCDRYHHSGRGGEELRLPALF